MAQVSGLTDRQIRTIIIRQMKDAPLPIAMQLSNALGVPLEVWTGDRRYRPTDITAEARQVARAYDKAAQKEKAMVRMALDLPPRQHEHRRLRQIFQPPTRGTIY